MTASIRVKGHARRIQAANVSGTGMYQRADGYDVTCSCGQWHDRVGSTEAAAKRHEQHKAAVLDGSHDAALQDDRERRKVKYLEVLAAIDAGDPRYRTFTRGQVEAWLAEVA